ncbi:non-ribosomal peptide synthetase [Bacillus sp. DX3.1]|uniref:non-ribosomal peptide synthetase n=1 Tax=Bacillus sp. DX3.1 TaxID=3052091 RepID=UPI002570498A|nr:non-ribosomal peptide synthetase [Bacillus sp. DX3.1]WJE83337.1 amino acid adenylation domain-containing protein [Bacillus sp. DX3.1]
MLDEKHIKQLEKNLENIPDLLEVLVGEVEETPSFYHLYDLFPERRDIGEYEGNVLSNSLNRENTEERVLSIATGEAIRVGLNEPKTLPEILYRASDMSPDKGITYISSDGTKMYESYPELLEKAQCILTGLRKLNIQPGDPVIFQFSRNQNFIPAFWACILGGFLPTPVAIAPTYTENNAIVKRLFNSWELFENPIILTELDFLKPIKELEDLWDVPEIKVAVIEDLSKNDPDRNCVYYNRDDYALHLLTSGSTGVPKCVQHSHDSILTRVRATVQFNGFTKDDITLNWMPLDHVGGLVMYHILSVYLACKQVIPTIEEFVENPLKWLDWIEEYKVTTTWAPNFAFALVNDCKNKIIQKNWDLSSVRHILNGAEAIVPKVALQFLKILESYGLSPECMFPSYGMSETSSGIVFSKMLQRDSETSGIHYIDKATLADYPKIVDPTYQDAIAFIEVGSPIPGVSIRIVDEKNSLIEEGRVGRLQVKGTNIMKGYYKNPKANEEVFVGDGWFNTGDLGFLREGRLTITGREKDVIIINGKNHFNYEIQAFVEEVGGVEITYSAACAFYDEKNGTDSLVIFFVPSNNYNEFLYGNIIESIRENVIRKIGINPKYILPIGKEQFPKTNSGKIQHAELVKQLVKGDFDEILKKIDIQLENRQNLIPDWMYQSRWIAKDLELVQEFETAKKESVLLFAENSELSSELINSLGNNTILVKMGTSFEKVAVNQYYIRVDKEEDYKLLFAELKRDKMTISHILHLFAAYPYKDKIEEVKELKKSQIYGSYSILHLVKTLSLYNNIEVKLIVVTTDAQMLEPTAEYAFEKSTLVGMIKTISHEMPSISTKVIDVASKDDKKLQASQIVQEWNDIKEGVVAYRGNKRFVPRLKKVELLKENKNETLLIEKGLYIITGGLGGVGQQITSYLLKEKRANVILLGRTSLFEEQHYQDGNINERIRAFQKLKQMEEYGGTLTYYAVDLSNAEEIEEIVTEAERKFSCTLTGIIHFAGIIQEILLKDQTIKKLEEMYEAKVFGSFVLNQIVKRRPNAFFCGNSSVTTLKSGVTLSAYVSANSFVEALSQYQRHILNMNAFCFSWSLWDKVGMSNRMAMKDLLKHQGSIQGYMPITQEFGLLSFLMGFRTDHSLLYVGLNGLKKVIEELLEEPLDKKLSLKVFFSLVKNSNNTKYVVGKIYEATRIFLKQQGINNELKLYFNHLDELPKLALGVIDRSILIDSKELKSKAGYIHRYSVNEKKLVEKWESLLNVNGIGLQDNFFMLGGNSLKAMQLVAMVKKEFNCELNVQDLFENPTIERLIGLLKKKGTSANVNKINITPIEERGNVLPLSYPQKSQWVLNQLDPESPYYNNTITMRLTGKLNKSTLYTALKEVVARHEVLRTIFVEKEGQPVQIIESRRDIELPYIDLTIYNEEKREKIAQELVQQEANKPFQIAKEVMRCQLLKLYDQEYLLIINIHHIAFDGWSVGVFQRDLAYFYDVFHTGKALEASHIPVQYGDYALWQSEILAERDLNQQMEFWKEELSGVIPVLELPTDYPRNVVQTNKGRTKEKYLSPELTRKLYQFSQKQDRTLYMVMLSAFSALLTRYTSQEDFVIGSIIANRNHVELENLIGCFINTLPVRIDTSGNPTMEKLIERVENRIMGMYNNKDVPFEKIVEELNLKRDPSRHVLFQVLFVLQNAPMQTADMNGVLVDLHVKNNNTSKFDLTLQIYEEKNQLRLCMEYNTDLFKGEMISRILTHYNNILEYMIDNSQEEISAIPMLTEQEKENLLYKWNDTKVEWPENKVIHQVFEEQAIRFPDTVAVKHGKRKMTYKELNERANQVAYILREKGVKPNKLIAIMMDRSMDMIIGLLGILKAGGAYVPIDPSYPEERITYMLEDSQCQILLTNGEVNKQIAFTGEVLDIHCIEVCNKLTLNLACINTPSDLAYVIYTSGTTGKPKGVLIEHRNVIRLMFNAKMPFNFTNTDVWTMFHSYCFDFSVWEMYGALLYGGKLIIIPRDVAQNPQSYLQILKNEQVTILNQTPSAFYRLIQEEMQNSSTDLNLRTVIFGGEALAPIQILPFYQKYKNVKFVNMYGITETTVHVTYKEVTEEEMKSNISNIGLPIPTLTAYVLDSNKNLLPVGVPGELYVGGEGLARGYLNQPKLTAERFVTNPFLSRGYLYRSGDLVKRLDDGTLEYFGRIDHQVKIRGFRIELGEIESQLLQHSDIKEAVVNVQEESEGEKYLCAYFVTEKDVTVATLRTHLLETLPDFMVPTSYVQLEEFPLTPNGKIDLRKLSGIKENVQRGTKYEAPSNETEQEFVGIWQDVLGIVDIGISDSFFDLGGDSIKAIQLINRINETCGLLVQIRDLYQYPTIRGLLASVNNLNISKEKEAYESAIHTTEMLKQQIFHTIEEENGDLQKIEDLYAMSDISKGMIYYSYENPNSALYHDQLVYTIKESGFCLNSLHKAMSILVQKHPILRTSFHIDEFSEPVQIVHRQSSIEIEEYSLLAMNENEQNNWLLQYLEENRRHSLEITSPMHWEMKVFHLNENSIKLVFICHHAMMDGWSVASFMTELMNVYLKIKIGEDVYLPPLKNTYKDYVVEQLAIRNRQDIKNYWRQELIDYKRFNLYSLLPESQQENKILTEVLDRELVQQALDLSKRYNTTFKMVCFVAFTAALNMFSYENDIVVGLVENNRPICEDGEKMLGCFLNTVPVRSKFKKNMTWEDMLIEIDRKYVELKLHGRLSLLEIMKAVEEEPQGQNPFFDVMFNFIDFHIYKDLEYEKLIEIDLETSYEKTNTLLDFTVSTTLDDYLIRINSILPDAKAKQLMTYFIGALRLMTKDAERVIDKADLLSLEEKTQLLIEFNQTENVYPMDKLIVELLEEATVDNRIGLVFEEKKLTICEINQKVNQVAHVLRNKGIVANQPVGIMIERSMEMVIGILAILKAGGAYVPINPNLPKKRIEYILEDSKVEVLLTMSSLTNCISFTGEILLLDNTLLYEGPTYNPEPVNDLNDIAYIIYTSGSTGNPKGVMVKHKNMMNLLYAMEELYPLGSQDAYLLKTNYMFDVSITELFGWIAGKGKLVILEPESEKEPYHIIQSIRQHNVTHVNFVPSMLHLFCYKIENLEEKLPTLRYIFAAGEALSTTLASQISSILPKVHLENIYGPTETTVYATKYSIDSTISNNIPIGKPFPNYQAYVLNKIGQIQPIGVQGELCITGTGVAQGYMNHEDLNKDVFVSNYFGEGMLYKTGDLACWLPEGNLEYKGRIDEQIKIRGNRVEIGEITKCLRDYPYIDEAVIKVDKDENDTTYLCAYVVGRTEIDFTDVRKYLSGILPDYMIPTYFVSLKEMPLTQTGKIDRKALPKIEKSPRSTDNIVSSRTDIEKIMLDIWIEVLKVSQIGVYDNFIELGGDSIKAIQIASRFNEAGYLVLVKDILKLQTVADICANLDLLANKKQYDQNIIVGEKRSTPIEKWFFGLNWPDRDFYNQTVLLDIQEEINIGALEKSFQQLIEHHDGLRLNFDSESGQPFFNNKHLERLFVIETVQLSSTVEEEKEIQRITSQYKKNFKIDHDLLVKAVLIQSADGRQKLFITIHHLLVDGVSWRILLEDLASLYSMRMEGENPRLPRKTASVKEWAEFMYEYSGRLEVLSEIEYWNTILSEEFELPNDFETTDWNMTHMKCVQTRLNKEKTSLLMKEAHRAYHTNINDLLLTALVKTLYDWSGKTDFMVELEGHGREIEEIDINRTIGWFTTMYPVKLHLSKGEIGEQIKGTKEQLRSIPNKGLNYGVLKYLQNKLNASNEQIIEIRFNYLGELDQFITNEPFSSLTFTSETSDRNNMTAKLDINCLVKEGYLEISMYYNSKAFAEETIDKVSNLFIRNLQDIITETIAQQSQEFTASDFDSADISQEELDFLLL